MKLSPTRARFFSSRYYID